MSAISHGWRPEGGPVSKIPLKVAKEFHAADEEHKYGKGQHKGRAFGGVAPTPMAGMPAMASQAFNPMMGGGTPAMGIAPGVPMQPQGMAAPMGGARPLKRGGVVASPTHPDGKMTTGPLVSAVPGRTDLHFTHVPSGSYVIPADIVSKWGEGNTLAGMQALHQKFKMGGPGSHKALASGGSSDRHIGKPVPVKLAGGEIVVPPQHVHETMQRLSKRRMTLDEAHKEMDKWVLEERKKLRKTLAKLPGPAKD